MSIFSNEDNWWIRLLGAIIRCAIEDYSKPDSPGFASAEKFLFGDIGKVNADGSPKNGLEWYMSMTDIDADAIRKHIPRHKR